MALPAMKPSLGRILLWRPDELVWSDGLARGSYDPPPPASLSNYPFLASSGVSIRSNSWNNPFPPYAVVSPHRTLTDRYDGPDYVGQGEGQGKLSKALSQAFGPYLWLGLL